MDSVDYTRINDLLAKVEKAISEGREVDLSPLLELYKSICSYSRLLMEERIQVAMLQNRFYSIIPREFFPICIPTQLSTLQLNELYDRLIELCFIEGGNGTREDFLSVFDPTTPAPHPLIIWKKTGRNKDIDIVSLLNFILIVGGEQRELEKYAKTFFGVSFSKATKSRAGCIEDLDKLGELLSVKRIVKPD